MGLTSEDFAVPLLFQTALVVKSPVSSIVDLSEMDTISQISYKEIAK